MSDARHEPARELRRLDFLFYCCAHPRDLHSFPTRRSSDLPTLGGSFEECPPSLLDFAARDRRYPTRSEEHTSELQSRGHLVCRLLLEKKKKHTSVRVSGTVESPGKKPSTLSTAPPRPSAIH